MSYRAFTTKTVVSGPHETFVITELEPREKHPMNWIDGAVSREGAWAQATSQILPVAVVPLNDSEKDLGIVFDPKSFERRVYGGYVAYGYGMSDGYYAPITFDHWVRGFKSDPRHELNGYGNNLTAEMVAGELEAYEWHIEDEIMRSEARCS